MKDEMPVTAKKMKLILKFPGLPEFGVLKARVKNTDYELNCQTPVDVPEDHARQLLAQFTQIKEA